MDKLPLMNLQEEFGGYPQIFRFRSPSKWTLSELEEGYVYFAERSELNDPHDANPRMIQFTKNSDELERFYQQLANSFPTQEGKNDFLSTYTPDSLRVFIEEKIEFYVLHFGVVCFTVHLKNFPLWANYANKSSGLCLQFNVEMDKELFKDFRPMKYIPKPKLLNFNPLSESEYLTKLFFYKTSDWSFEKEWRLLKVHTGKFYFNRDALEKIILGYNAKPKFIKEVKDIVKRKYPNTHLFLMKKPDEFDKLSFTTI